uniref:Ent-kaur-16-ene synthase, chloroplastic n=1 Tax=Aegilops tauschii TaxID=37682 RepID=R7WDL9_AEGTA
MTEETSLLVLVLASPPAVIVFFLPSTRLASGLGRWFLHVSVIVTSTLAHAFSKCTNNSINPVKIANGARTFVGENASLQNMERKARIKKQLQEPKLSPSSYDTAWVAMVPLPGSSQEVPCFPQCIEWILQNQQISGSWGLAHMDSSVNKATLSSTLACVLALQRWNVGREHIRRVYKGLDAMIMIYSGIHFIGKNISVVMDKQIAAPIGFNIIFPGMLSLAMGMGLQFPVRKANVDGILHLRELELERLAADKSFGREAYIAYVVEGLGNLLDWNEVMKFQRRNGSLFNSPSTTAAALIQNYDDKALQYLNLLVMPTVYPTNIYCQLSMVDTLEKVGISRYFSSEIKSILDMTYRCWLQRDEEIILDVSTCAMAFRILRMNGYDISSDELSHIDEASTFHNSLQGYLSDTKSIMELYKASGVSVSENELTLDNISYWSGNLLREKIFHDDVQSRSILAEVEYALKFPFYATMDRLDHKRNIENFDLSGSQMLKTEHWPCCVNQDILALAIEDFTISQSVYRSELQLLECWVKENKLDQLLFARQRTTYCYLAAAATMFPPELSDARISWAKNSILVNIVDDFFDVAGSREELENLVELIEKWDEHYKDEFYSEQVQILFYAIYTSTSQLGTMASVVQNRDVKKHLVETWLQLLRTMMTEADWRMRQYVPTVEEYMKVAVVSFTVVPILLPASYFVRQALLACVVNSQEYNELFRLMGTCCRLLNDIQGFERESSEGKLDSVSLRVLHADGSMSIEAAKDSIKRSIVSCRKDLLRLVLKQDSVVPRACKELFWNMCKICHLFYSHTDAFTSPSEMVTTVNAVINEPLKLQISNPSFATQSEK